ncbi:MAG: hypothetical protein OXI71_07820 [Gemmatimonadota bacterium]|nr:hypothetical protein [Gemmatimonadota bacterium]
MTAHLKGREKALAGFGWSGSEAEWIALVCLHSGVFTRAQLSARLGIDRWKAYRFVRALTEQGVASEETFARRKVCRIFARPVYRALGAEHVRHRKTASEEVLMRRLLSLDYVIEHTDLPWLPTEPEKVAAFEALGIERAALPVRVYGRGGRETRRYFPVKLPVALEAERAVFVYTDPGHGTATAIRSWGAAHRRLWRALGKRGRTVEVVAVARRPLEIRRARKVMRAWAEGSGAGEPGAVQEEEIARIEQAIRGRDDALVEELGGLQGCLVRIVELKNRRRSTSPAGTIGGFKTWRPGRFPGGGS